MPDDDLLARADKHRTAGDGYLCIHCGERWPCTTSDVAAALRAAREREAKAADQLDGIFYALRMQVIRTLREVVSAPPPTSEDDDE